MVAYNLTIDQEFKELLPPLSEEEYSELRESIKADGIREPIRLWNGVIVDGHNRYEIAKTYGLEYATINVQFESRDEVLVWIVKNQIARRNLKDVDRIELALKIEAPLKRILEAKRASAGAGNLERFHIESGHAISGANNGTANSPTSKEGRLERAKEVTAFETEVRSQRDIERDGEGWMDAHPTTIVGNLEAAPERIKFRYEAAKVAGVSSGKLQQYQVIKANRPEEIEKIRSGEKTVGAVYKQIHAEAKKEEEKARVEARAANLDVDSLGVEVKEGLFSRSDVTGAALAIIDVVAGVEAIQAKIAQVVLSSGSLVIITRGTEILKAGAIPVNSMVYRGITYLKIDGKVSYALTFSKTPQNVPESLEGAYGPVMMELIEARTLPGDVVVFPVAGFEEVAFIATEMQRKAIVFDGDMPAELAVRFQGVRDKLYGPLPQNVCDIKAGSNPNYAAAKKLGCVDEIYHIDKKHD